MREIIYNIQEFEELTNKRIGPEVCSELLNKCPVDLEIPMTVKMAVEAGLNSCRRSNDANNRFRLSN